MGKNTRRKVMIRVVGVGAVERFWVKGGNEVGKTMGYILFDVLRVAVRMTGKAKRAREKQGHDRNIFSDR